jgi:hypothetical protein
MKRIKVDDDTHMAAMIAAKMKRQTLQEFTKNALLAQIYIAKAALGFTRKKLEA